VIMEAPFACVGIAYLDNDDFRNQQAGSKDD
jgi:hypothetical protein